MLNRVGERTISQSVGCPFYFAEMKKDELKKWIEELKAEGKLWKFYKSKEWIELKSEVLREHHYECYECKKQGKITRYDIDDKGNKTLICTVHHIQYVRKNPALALSKTYEYQGKIYLNLVPVCKACHNKLHPEKNKRDKKQTGYTNQERW